MTTTLLQIMNKCLTEQGEVTYTTLNDYRSVEDIAYAKLMQAMDVSLRQLCDEVPWYFRRKLINPTIEISTNNVNLYNVRLEDNTKVMLSTPGNNSSKQLYHLPRNMELEVLAGLNTQQGEPSYFYIDSNKLYFDTHVPTTGYNISAIGYTTTYYKDGGGAEKATMEHIDTWSTIIPDNDIYALVYLTLIKYSDKSSNAYNVFVDKFNDAKSLFGLQKTATPKDMEIALPFFKRDFYDA